VWKKNSFVISIHSLGFPLIIQKLFVFKDFSSPFLNQFSQLLLKINTQCALWVNNSSYRSVMGRIMLTT
jgi:hypothetical protein